MLLLFSTTLQAQNNYQNLWEKVYEQELKNLPKSALKIVEEIYAKAVKDNNSPQLIKTLLYKSKFSLTLEEDAQLKIINEFKNEIRKSTTPTKNLLENILANLYWQYFNQNRWKFYNRTQTATKVDINDFRTWDLQTLFKEIHTHYQNSLRDKNELQKTDVYKFVAILKTISNTKKYRPTLYDFLAHNALEFYKTNETHITKPAYQFKIDNSDLLCDATLFSKLKLTTKDVFSLQFNALKIYQELITLHQKKQHLDALVNVDLERLDFINEHATFSDKETVFLETLKTSENQYKNKTESGLYTFEIANIYHAQANRYSKNKNKSFRFKNKEALALCENIIKQFPKSRAAQKANSLISQIKRKSIQITSEKHIAVNTFSRLLVSYKNVEKLYFTAYQIDQKKSEKFNKIYKPKEKTTFIQQLKKITQWNTELPNEFDYLSHTNEVIIPQLPRGMYLIVASEKETISEKDIFGTSFIQATNLTLVSRNEGNKDIYQVVDRNTGKPISKARIRFLNEKSRYNKKIDKIFTSDKNGEFTFSPNTYYDNVKAYISSKNDKAVFGDYYLRKRNNYSNNSSTQTRTFLFTDRSIYRPGQTVYFKGISLENHQRTSTTITNKNVTVVLKDVNYQEIKTLELTTNEFGSFSGEFIIPNTGLTGSFTIDASIKGIRSQQSFSVEEYKRPKFETEFKPVTNTYRINDKIKVTGFAKSFAGATVTDAKVVYKVHRKVQYPRWCYWYYPHLASESQGITNGETKTNDSGEFEITFTALADKSVDKENLPVFTYEITADVTDINGETRSTNSLVKIGYHSLLASVEIKEKIDKTEKEHRITINTKNLNNEFVPASGEIAIYKLTAPKKPLRKRPWASPDYQTISKKEFATKFPHDAYKNEDKPLQWEKGSKVFSSNFNTESSKEISLKNIKKWTSGKYLIEVSSKDKFNQKVTDKKYFSVFSEKDKLPADNKLISVKTDKETYNAGDTAEITFSSNSEDITIMVFIEKEHKVIASHYLQLDKNSKTIRVPVTNKDVGGFGIRYHYVNYNAFKNGHLIINVPYPKTEVEITTNTFRDKLQPGSKETWSFTVKGAKKDKVSAELLASMYDASLDQFKQHQWDFNPIPKPKYYVYSRANATTSFGKTAFRIDNLYRNNYSSYPTLSYHQLNWFGFSFRNQRWAQQQYLRSLAIQRTKFDGILSGVIEDSSGALPGVSVIIKGTSFGTVTDFDGKFSLKANKGDIIIFSYIGYKTKQIEVGDFSNLLISMEDDSQTLNEVVVARYGSIKNKNQAAPLERKLAGKAAGVRLEAEMVVENDEVGWSPKNSDKFTPGNSDKLNIHSDEVVDLKDIPVRKNLQETAFFYPHLTTDSNGNVSFSFTAPEALTRWKLQLLAHTKELHSATKTFTTVTQKELMVVPNAPRFLREKDQITLSAKISNLSDKNLQGVSQLILTDAITSAPLSNLSSDNLTKSFSVDKNGNTNVSWNLTIPETVQAVQYKVIAKAGNFSDGEQSVLPVLSNRMLVTETLPMWVRSNQTKTFTLDKLKNNTSTTLKHHKLSLEITSNPAWYAVQALPYLMEYPHECAEQTFSRYYANTLASFIANSNPRIQEVFAQWKSSKSLLSNLEKNEDLKSLIIQETPWLRDAQSETEQKKRIALLFDLNKMQNEQTSAIRKLKNIQMNNGGFPWFKGSRYPSISITNYIVAGFGHLKKLGVQKLDKTSQNILTKAIRFLDMEFADTYKRLLKKADNLRVKQGNIAAEKFLKEKHVGYAQIQYLYMRSFFNDISINKSTQIAIDYYANQSVTFWNDFNLYAKGQIALHQYRANNTSTANKILNSLKENSITSEELGMYWKENKAGWYWHQAPIETQSLLIEAFSEIAKDTKLVDNLKIWLLKNKQVSQWKTTKATAEAVYALLLQGSNWISSTELVDVKIGGKKIDPSKLENTKVEAGTGYFKTSWNGNEITPKMSSVTLTKKDKGIAWGGLYWQYFEDLDKITSAKTPLQLSKKLFKKVNSDTGKKLIEVTNSNLVVGDLVTVRVELRVDRSMEFIHMKDMRASAFEPVDVISNYKWQDGLGYYQSTKDAATHFFFNRLPKGVYVFEYDVRVNNKGSFSNGITTIQSMYAPEFSSHSKGVRVEVK